MGKRCGLPLTILFIPFLFLFCFSTIYYTQEKEVKKILVIAHRGASGYAPENTLSAFKKAMEQKADMIELDVYQSKDGEIIVIHDKTIDRTTDGKGEVSQLTLKEIKKYDAGRWFKEDFAGEKIPTLSEAIDLIKGNILLNVELKCEEKKCVDKVVKIIEEKKMTSSVIISSFHHHTIKRVKELNPKIKTAALVVSPPDLKKLVREYKPDALNINYFFLSQKVFASARQLNLEINVWTVNDENIMKKFIEMGVDGIITNYPDKLISLISKEEK